MLLVAAVAVGAVCWRGAAGVAAAAVQRVECGEGGAAEAAAHIHWAAWRQQRFDTGTRVVLEGASFARVWLLMCLCGVCGREVLVSVRVLWEVLLRLRAHLFPTGRY